MSLKQLTALTLVGAALITAAYAQPNPISADFISLNTVVIGPTGVKLSTLALVLLGGVGLLLLLQRWK